MRVAMGWRERISGEGSVWNPSYEPGCGVESIKGRGGKEYPGNAAYGIQAKDLGSKGREYQRERPERISG